jgi:putative exosortase-associated protein (TIGR04073 family)
MRKVILAMIIAMVFCAAARVCLADDALDKLGRGLANVATGWMDVPKEIGKRSEDDSNLLGALLVAPVKGLLKAVGRTIVGAYEVVTFPLPTYKPLVEPEFVWQRNQ